MEQAESGHPNAQFQLGRLYATRTAVSCLPQDPVQAAQWYQRAAASGHTRAMVSLGTVYRLGLGLDKDTDRGLQLYRQAAALGDVDAMRRLGTIYYTGEGLPDRDLGEAEKWFRMAYQHGDWRAEGDLLKILKEVNPEEWAQRSSKSKAFRTEERRRREERAVALADRLFGTIAVIVPSGDYRGTRPENAVEGIDYKPLKVLLGVPVGFLYALHIGAVVLPVQIASMPSTRQVQEQQQHLSEIYERYGNDKLVREFQSRIVQEANEHLNNQTFAAPGNQAPGTDRYKGISHADTVLEIETIVSGLQLMDAEKTKALFTVAANYRLVRVKDRELLGEGVLRYSGKTKKLDEWTMDDGSTLKDEIELGAEAIAKQAVGKLLKLASRQPYS